MQKEACKMVERAKVFVFTDVATILEPQALQMLIKHFHDTSIGVVEGNKKIVTDGVVSSEGIYLRYENAIRRLEAQVNSQVGAGGCLFAARKCVVDRLFLRETMSDFSAGLVAGKLGLRTITEDDAVAVFSDLKDPNKEYARKHRTILRGINTLWAYRELLNPFTYGFFSFQLWSHKVAKWLVPFALIGLFISSFMLCGVFFAFAFSLQIIFYSLAVMGLNPNLTQPWFKIPSFFLLSNVAMFHAWCDFFRGKQMMVWSASDRQ
jgi:hypothetical protein